MKVWCVFLNDYEGSFLDKIFMTQEKATLYAKEKNESEKRNTSESSYSEEECEVEE